MKKLISTIVGAVLLLFGTFLFVFFVLKLSASGIEFIVSDISIYYNIISWLIVSIILILVGFVFAIYNAFDIEDINKNDSDA